MTIDLLILPYPLWVCNSNLYMCSGITEAMNMEILRDIGMTDGEIRVYVALIRLGSATSGPVTDKSGVSRAKVYNILERLMQKGLVSYIIKDKTRHYQAEDPVKIKDYLDKKEIEFKRLVRMNRYPPQQGWRKWGGERNQGPGRR